MTELLEAYKSHLIYIAIVLVAFLLLRMLTNVLHKWLLKKKSEQFSHSSGRSLTIMKKVLNTLWLLLAFIAMAFVFVDRETDIVLVGYFKLISYLGFVAVITIVLATGCNVWFKQKIEEKVSLDYDATSYRFLRYVAVFTICFIGVLVGLMAFPSMKSVAQTALGGAGVIAIIAGVASQEALSNLVGGVFIISFKPFKIGDVIKVTDTMVGTVTDITLRHTVIRNFENKMIVIPNAIINKEKLINYDLGEKKCCEHIELGITYDSNVELAKKILREECEKHPFIFDNRTEADKKDGLPMVKTALTKFNDSSVTIRAWAWAETFGNAFTLKCDVFESTKKRFDAEGVGLAFPTRTVYIKNETEKAKEN